MTLDVVAVGEVVKASTMNALIGFANNTNRRAVFVADGTWSVPDGVQAFKVTLCGGGGRGHASVTLGFGEDTLIAAGGEGGDAPMISAVFTGYDPGTSFDIEVGAGGTSGTPTGGASSFGTTGLASNGGGIGGNSSGVWYDVVVLKGNPGTATFPSGAPTVFHANGTFCRYVFRYGEITGFGKGGRGGAGGKGYGGTYESLHSPGPEDGAPGVVVIEW